MRKLIIFVIFFIIGKEMIAQQSMRITATPNPVCISDAVRISLENIAGSVQSIQWTFGANASPASSTSLGPHNITYSAPGKKKIIVEVFITGIAASIKDSITIDVSELLNNDIVKNVVFNPSSTYILDANATIKTSSNSVAPYKYKWSVNDFESDLSEENRNFSYCVSEDGNYNVQLYVEDKAQCKIIWDTTLTTQSVFRAPNIFTPNNDGINDTFIIESNGIRRLSIEIYDRWGSTVFRPNYYANQIIWDGRNSSGTLVQPGVYFYVVSVEDDSVAPLKGFVHVYYEK